MADEEEPTWYRKQAASSCSRRETPDHDVERMKMDDRHLQPLYADIRKQLSRCARVTLHDVHAYPSMRCTYTLDKRRVFVRMRDDHGERFADCIVRYVLVHELAHVLNATTGHDESFRRLLRRLEQCARRHPMCPENVAEDFNRCHG